MLPFSASVGRPHCSVYLSPDSGFRCIRANSYVNQNMSSVILA